MTKHHIIIGDGVTAAEFATTHPFTKGDSLSIIGPDVDKLGRGVAYASAPDDAPWKYAYLLNSPARSVDIAFSQWLHDNWHSVAERMVGRSPDWLGAAQHYVDIDQIASLNAPREFYGDFFHADTIQKLHALETRGIRIQTIRARVSRISNEQGNLSVHTNDGQQFSADSIDVATGGPQNQRIPGDDAECSFPELFGNEVRIMEKLGASGSILAIGSGAAMLDLLRFCQSVQSAQHIKFTAISGSGRTLEALRPGKTFSPAEYDINEQFERADDFIAAIKAAQKKAFAAGHDFYETRVGLRSLFFSKSVNEFVPKLSEARKVARPLFTHFEGGTRDSIDDFHRLQKSGNAQILSGRVQTIEPCATGASIVYLDENGKVQKREANVIVNCAGPGRENRFDALTQQLLEQEWISICEQSGGLLVGDAGNTTVPGVRYLGPAVTSIGDVAQAVPLYDAFRLRRAVQQFNARESN